MKTKDIFLSDNSIANDFVKSFEYPFEVLPNIKDYIIKLGKSLGDDFEEVKENVWIHKSAKVSPSAEINGPCIIDSEAEIRHSAFIRHSAIVGKKCVLGNSCELKNSILYDFVQVPHLSYVSDSILGFHSHVGASTILCNLKNDKKDVIIRYNGEVFETHLRKVGSFLGDYAEVGCSSVLNPGTIVMPNSNIYPLTLVRGIIPANSIVKSMDNIVPKEDR